MCLQLSQVPLAGVLIRVCLVFATIFTSILHVIFVLLIDRVVGQMDKLRVRCFLIVCILLGCKSYEAFLEQVYLEWVKARDESVDAQIILEAVDQVRIADVL